MKSITIKRATTSTFIIFFIILLIISSLSTTTATTKKKEKKTSSKIKVVTEYYTPKDFVIKYNKSMDEGVIKHIKGNGKYKEQHQLIVKTNEGYLFDHWEIKGKYRLAEGTLESEKIALILNSNCNADAVFRYKANSSLINANEKANKVIQRKPSLVKIFIIGILGSIVLFFIIVEFIYFFTGKTLFKRRNNHKKKKNPFY